MKETLLTIYIAGSVLSLLFYIFICYVGSLKLKQIGFVKVAACVLFWPFDWLHNIKILTVSLKETYAEQMKPTVSRRNK